MATKKGFRCNKWSRKIRGLKQFEDVADWFAQEISSIESNYGVNPYQNGDLSPIPEEVIFPYPFKDSCFDAKDYLMNELWLLDLWKQNNEHLKLETPLRDWWKEQYDVKFFEQYIPGKYCP